MEPMSEAERVAGIRERSAQHLRRYLASDGQDGYEQGDARILILTTTGRRSGEPRSTPLIFHRDGDRYVIVASLGGAPHHPSWYLNLRDNPHVRIQVKGQHFEARARTAMGDERARLWPLMTAIHPFYDDFQQRTEREIPVVVLEPIS
jgi:deazaflavin-dependent oxidoreductase (nitroreductase family)